MLDQRRFKRLSVHSLGRAESAAGRHFGIVARDITPEGIGLITGCSLKQGDDLSVCFNLEDRKVCCKVKVMWARFFCLHHKKNRYVCGVKITEASQISWLGVVDFYSRKIMRQFSRIFSELYPAS